MASNQTQAVKDPVQLEEERLEDAFAHLNQLHLQLRELRSALPRMLEPLKAKQPSPEAMYSTFVRSYDSTIKEVARFGEALGGQETKQAFELAGESRKRAPKVKQWRPAEDPNWAEPPSKRIKTV